MTTVRGCKTLMMNTTVSRSVPPWLAPVIQDLELNGSTLVTVDDIQRARPELDRAVARRGLAQLVERGWLHPTNIRGTYEFIPGAAAGPYPSGDPWLVLRAVLAQRPSQFHVGATSAAWLLGYAQRSPEQHIVVTTPQIRIPRSLRAAYRVLETTPAPAHGTIDGLPVPTPPELFVETAQLTPRLNLDAARGWLCRLLNDISPQDVVRTLKDRGAATHARAGYFADICGTNDHAAAIEAGHNRTTGPFYTGPRHSNSPFSARWRIYDTGHVGEE